MEASFTMETWVFPNRAEIHIVHGEASTIMQSLCHQSASATRLRTAGLEQIGPSNPLGNRVVRLGFFGTVGLNR